jgi:hypothetical protein
MKRAHITIGVILSFILLAVHLAVVDDYGITWDFHHHFFAGLYHMGIPLREELTRQIPFTVPDPRGTYALPFGPLMLIAPAVTYRIFHELTGILAFDNAYHLAIIIQSTAGIFVLYLFLLEAFGFATGLAGLTFLALLPRYWGDLHNNMKDAPQAAAFALAIYLFWRLARNRRLRDLAWASVAFAVAFNTKVNTLMVPVIAGAWMAGNAIFNARLRRSSVRPPNFFFPFLYFITAPAAAVLLWLPFWQDPIDRLVYMFRFFLDNTQNLEVLYFGTVYKSAIDVPWHYPLGYLAITTPLPILIFFIVGLIGIVIQFLRKIFNFQISNLFLLFLWFFLPLSRYLNPKIGVIDGIRHFEEVVYPLSAIAAVGAVWLLGRIKNIPVIIFIIVITVIIIIKDIIAFHPYQISYFNELTGGIRGAQGAFDVEYWGTSQKAAMRWINKNAPKDSFVHVLMAGDAAAKYLRPDLLAHVNQKGFDAADYVVILNRESFFDRYWGSRDYMARHKPVFSVSVGGVPLTMIYETRKQ